MTPRRRPVPGTVFALLVVMIFATTVGVHALPLDASDPWLVNAINDIGHVLGFLVVTATLLFSLARIDATAQWSPRSRRLVVAALIFCLAASSEAVQALVPSRTASWPDLARDVAGGMLGMIAVIAMGLASMWRWLTLFGCTIALLAVVSTPLARIAAVFDSRPHRPLRFEARLDRYRVEAKSADLKVVTAPADWPTAGRVMRVEPAGHRRSEGVTLHNLPEQWSRFQALKFVIAGEGRLDALDLRLASPPTRENRRGGTRVRLPVAPAARTVVLTMEDIRSVPPQRPANIGPLDLGHVTEISILTRSRTSDAFYLDEIRLE
ncbi:MAG: VanZ family protein [Myxococcales bacterium]|nr:VanZ family protein [Myxococcales bacterium]